MATGLAALIGTESMAASNGQYEDDFTDASAISEAISETYSENRSAMVYLRTIYIYIYIYIYINMNIY